MVPITHEVVGFRQDAAPDSLLCSSSAREWTFGPVGPLGPHGAVVGVALLGHSWIAVAKGFVPRFRDETFADLASNPTSTRFSTNGPFRPLGPVWTILSVTRFALLLVSKAKFVVDLSGNGVDALPETSSLAAGTCFGARRPIAPRTPFYK